MQARDVGLLGASAESEIAQYRDEHARAASMLEMLHQTFSVVLSGGDDGIAAAAAARNKARRGGGEGGGMGDAAGSEVDGEARRAVVGGGAALDLRVVSGGRGAEAAADIDDALATQLMTAQISEIESVVAQLQAERARMERERNAWLMAKQSWTRTEIEISHSE